MAKHWQHRALVPIGNTEPPLMSRALASLMAQVQARYPNQPLPPGTPEMYLTEWKELAQQFGLSAFQEALSKAIRSSRVFPDPLEIRELLHAKKRADSERAESQKILRQLGEWQAQWLRERAEDAA